jgi:pimeloyl-ACP methyl ester carboxylesterase
MADCIVVPADSADTMQGMARDVLKAAPDRFAIAGFSMGGYVATEVLRQAPARVTRVALLDTSSRVDTPEKAAGRRRTIADCENGRFDQVIARFVPQLLHPDRMAEPLADRVRAMGHRVGAALFARRHRAMLTRSAPRDVLEAFAGPVRVITGRSDQLTPMEEHEELAAWSRGRLSIVEDCGHMPPLERPQAATALLRDWLLYD